MERLVKRDWTTVEETLKRSNPFNFVVLDDFLTLDTLTRLRTELIAHQGWKSREISHENDGAHWVIQQQFNDCSDLALIEEIALETQGMLSTMFTGKNLV